jgi:hypothetical protein
MVLDFVLFVVFHKFAVECVLQPYLYAAPVSFTQDEVVCCCLSFL